MFKLKNIAVALCIIILIFFGIFGIKEFIHNTVIKYIVAVIFFIGIANFSYNFFRKFEKKKPCPQCDKHKKFKEDYQKMIENSQKKLKPKNETLY